MSLISQLIFSITLLISSSIVIEANFFHEKSCKYFKFGQFYRGPCNSKKLIFGNDYNPHHQSPVIPDDDIGEIRFRPKKKHHNIKQGQKPFNRHGNIGYSPTFCTTSDGFEGICQPPAYCFSQFDDFELLIHNKCELPHGLTGVCCTKSVVREPAVQYLPIRIPIPQHPVVELNIDEASLNKAAEDSRKIIKKQLKLERDLIRAGFFQQHQTSEAFHQAFFGPHDKDQQRITRDGLVALETTLQLAKRYQLSPTEARDGLLKYSLASTALHEHCPKIPRCDRHTKYRKIDGSCNNLENPFWGKSLTELSRLLPPAYGDGLNSFRKSVDGSALPNAREVSLVLATDVDIPDKKFTLFVMQWGQFIDHDLTLSASTRADSGEGLHCCMEENRRASRIQHPACKPIYVPKNDPFYSRHNHKCNNFVRNAAGPRNYCNLGFREQINQLTQIIDGSMVYGSTSERAAHLRSFDGGKLRIDKVNGVEFLPFDTENRSDECAIPRERVRRGYHCFVGGDVRVNEQTGLTMLHNLLLREHNRIASALQTLNPEWTDEIIYQEARRIVAAMIQHITYNEWMPLILGRRVMKEFKILPQPSGYCYDYDPTVNPNILNSFATAAYRFHTLIQGIIKLINNQNGQLTQTIQLRNTFNNPSTIYRRGAFDDFLNGYTIHPTQTFDQFFTEDLTNHLFQEEGSEFGMDLISLNIQRGRDHGLPGYNFFREVCGQYKARGFEDLVNIMRRGSAERMAKVYKHVDDIDLFIGLNHEKALPGAVVGPTMGCILAEQARRNKVGDRFWYENGDMPHSFSEAQLHEIRKSSLARLICDNSDSIETMQQLAFIQPSEWNPRVGCEKISQMNLALWKGERVFG